MEALNLKEGQVIITIIALGYPKEKTIDQKQRKEFEKVVFFEKIN